MTASWTPSKHFAPIIGRWRIDDDSATYIGPDAKGVPHPFGISVGDTPFRAGRVRVHVRMEQTEVDFAARILLGYRSPNDRYLSVGLGGYSSAYVVAIFEPAVGWVALASLGNPSNLKPGHDYVVAVEIQGQRLRMSLDDISILAMELALPIPLGQLGLFAWGAGPLQFSEFSHALERPRAFVVMQFTDPYHALYKDVIHPVAKTLGFDAFHVGEVSGPGLILQDITRAIVEADVVIADITPANQNVFYELGYSHALRKPTILLAERTKQLPFDVSGYRCLMYDNTIAGKHELEEGLARHLRAIQEGRT
jgi:hypothetical protein